MMMMMMMAEKTSIGMALVLASVACLAPHLAQAQLPLAAADSIATSDHYLLHDACESVINEQIGWEMYASITYLNMAGYFDRPSVARPGFAKFFRDQSLEEYNHAGKFIDYINQRNGSVRAIAVDQSQKSDWSSPSEALADAIKLEKHVYAKIQHIHAVAEQKCQDAHLTDFLEGYFFAEQVESIRELQTMLTVLSAPDSVSQSVIEHMEDVRLRSGSGKKKEEL